MNDDVEFDVALESQGCAKLVSNLVDRLRNINPYSPAQVLEVCVEAADEIERLRTEINNQAFITETLRNHQRDQQRAVYNLPKQ